MPAPRSTTRVRTHALGDAALLAELGTRLDTALNTRAIALAAALKKRRDVRQAIAGYASVTVHFDPDLVTHEALTAAIKRLASKRPPMAEPGRLHRIPVVYDGPDMEAVAAGVGLSARGDLLLYHPALPFGLLVGVLSPLGFVWAVPAGVGPPLPPGRPATGPPRPVSV